MKNDIATDPPRLAAPGAGLPKPELFIARLIFGRFRRKMSRDQVTSLFKAERDLILQLAESCAPADGVRPVLIKRLRGLEDSSRNWSVYMTLEHLRIVNAAVADCISALVAGTVPPGAASTAAVKPAPGIDATVVKSFSNGCDELLQEILAVSSLKTAAKYPHPWFGPLDAAGWHAMGAFHMRLHRAQIEKIVGSLSRGLR